MGGYTELSEDTGVYCDNIVNTHIAVAGRVC